MGLSAPQQVKHLNVFVHSSQSDIKNKYLHMHKQRQADVFHLHKNLLT